MCVYLYDNVMCMDILIKQTVSSCLGPGPVIRSVSECCGESKQRATQIERAGGRARRPKNDTNISQCAVDTENTYWVTPPPTPYHHQRHRGTRVYPAIPSVACTAHVTVAQSTPPECGTDRISVCLGCYSVSAEGKYCYPPRHHAPIVRSS